MALVDRLSKLDAPDREVDAEIMSLFYVRGKHHIGAYMENDFGIDEPVDSDVWIDPKTDRWVSTSALFFTASKDAAIALAARVLPGWTFEHIGQDYIRASGLDNDVMPMGWTVEISDGSQTIQGQAPTLPLAICIALLRAKEANHV